jgi:Pro-kumamolisin, activation domain
MLIHKPVLRPWSLNLLVLFVFVATLALTLPGFAQNASGHEASVVAPISPLITRAIDEGSLVKLARNTRPEANHKNDRGRVSDSWDADHMLMVLQRSPEKEQELVRYIDSLNDRSSPNFHHWLTAEEFGARYGLAQQDIDAITGWMESHGFRVNKVFTSRMMIDFSGTAGSIREALHTEIHQLDVNGQMHFSNISDPQIPAALAPAVKGIFSLNDFKPEPMYKSAKDYTFAGCTSSSTTPAEPGTCYSVTPQDNAVIYNLNPLWNSGISGQGQTIALVEDTNTYTTGTAETTDSDWSTYRSTFGLSGYSSTYSTVHPGGCTDPGINGDDGEAAIDVEMASAFAPSANIELISCSSGSFTFGGVLAIANLVNNPGPYPGVISMSYGLCEAATGNGGNAYFYNAFEQAAAQGISAFASTGDAGTGQCGTIFTAGEDGYNVTSLAITGWGESPFNVAVGGTDFEDTYNSKTGQNGGAALSKYWGQTPNPTAAPYGSALSYVPEIPWDDSCANALLGAVVNGSPFTTFTTYGSTGACNKTPGNSTSGYLVLGAGSGGASSCATGNGGTNQSSAAASDTYCQGYPKPSYQSGAGLLNGHAVYGSSSDGVRDVPDVSMFASNGPWGHFETVCWSDPSQTSGGAVSCAGAPSTWAGFGGTSVAAPSLAGIQALINQQSGSNWGNPNPIYYQIAQNQYGTTASGFIGSLCNASGTGGPGPGCVFNDVTQGDIDVACEDDSTLADSQCYKPSGTYGVNSTDAISGTTILTGGVGYTSNPTCTVAGPANANPYKSPTGSTLFAGGTQATCTATFNAGSTTAVYTIKFIGTGTAISTDYPNLLGFTIGGVTYTFVSSLTGAPANSVLLVTGNTSASETSNAKNLEAAINANSAQCNAAPCFGTGTVANPLATATETTSTVTITAKTAGYAGNFTVSFAPTNVFFQVLEAATISQTTAGSGPGYVSAITITAAGTGYAPQTPVTFSGGGGSGALALANTTSGTAASSYQPAYGAAPGYDLATGLGSVNGYNMVTNCAWVIPPATPGLYCPTTSGSLPGPNVTFYWAPYPGATNYWLDLGSTAGGNNYLQTGPLPSTQTFVTAVGLPENGMPIYATWWYEVGGTWSNIQVTYNAYGAGSTLGVITSPAPNSILPGSSVTFNWTAGTQSTAYELTVGSSVGGNQYYQSGNLGNVTSQTVNSLPTNGAPVYVTLFSYVSGSWLYNEYTYTAFSTSGGAIATLTSPSPNGSTLPGSSVTFTWAAGTDTASAYWIDVGSAAGGNQYYQSGSLPTSTTSETVSNLPTDSSEVFVTLYTLVGGTWYSNPYTFYAASSSTSCVSTITSPAPGSELTAYSDTFSWTVSSSPGCSGAVTAYELDAGTNTSENYYDQSGNIGNVLTWDEQNLPPGYSDPPATGPVQMTLWNLIGGNWIASPEVGYCASGSSGYPACTGAGVVKGGR